VTEQGPRWTRLEHDERRAQIVAAARALIAERHWASVSTQEVAAAAGVTRGLLHHYFRTKHDLYLEVAREMLRMPPIPVPAPDSTGTAEELWARSVDAWLGIVEANRDSWLAAVRAGELGDDPALRELVDEAGEVLVDRVLQALGLDGAEVPVALRAVVRAYGGLAQEATREWLERGRLSREQVRLLLVGTLPLVVEHVVPSVVASEASGIRRGGRARAPRRAG
jgi:AcrR family transcriptional regulator